MAPPSLDALVAPPHLRVGVLVDASRASLGSDAGVIVWGSSPGSRTTDRRIRVPRATFLPLDTGSDRPRFRVQVANTPDEFAARDAAARAEAAAELAPFVRWHPGRQVFRARVGDFATREEASDLARRLAGMGLSNSVVTEERGAVGIRLLETGEELAQALVVPVGRKDTLSLDATPYRGVLEIRTGQGGTITVVNIVNMEEYLRGVVPNEISPIGYPEIEALKAQAVAARTYALRNRGQFEAKGYDICATTACQVYRGQSTENPLSDRAVLETRGLALSYRGAWINAFYTSTCGGHTEDGGSVFEGEDWPYLRGVACEPERSAWAFVRTTTAPGKAVADEDGLTRDAAVLVSLGVLDPRTYSQHALKGPSTDAEVRAWTTRLLGALHRHGCDAGAAGAVLRRGSFFRHLASALCWEEREKRLLAQSDPDYLLQLEDRQDLVAESERLAVAVLIQEGILMPFPDNTIRPNAALSRAQAIGILARAALRAGPPALVTGVFRSLDGDRLRLKRGEVEDSYPLEPTARLFRSLEGKGSAVSEVGLTPGDRVSLILQDGRAAFLEVEANRLGAAADRTSRYYRWEVRMTSAEVAQAISRYGSVGRVKDLVTRRFGVSGRVLELAVVGSEGELTLSGTRIRAALGLRENLFIVEREMDKSGGVARFVITGKGWGHGVGLCQVGAYGMAVAGSSYDQILRHYYTGVALQAAY